MSKIEEIIESIGHNVVNVSEEFRLFKNSFMKNNKKIKEVHTEKKENMKILQKDVNNKKSADETQSVLRMKTFNELQLDLSLLSDKSKKERKNNNNELINMLNLKIKQKSDKDNNKKEPIKKEYKKV